MFPAVALVIAFSALQPATTPTTRPAPPPVSEAEPVAVPPATPTALRYYTSGNQLWVLDQVVSIVLLAVILFSGLSAKLRTWARRIGRDWFFTIVLYWTLFTILTFAITLPLTYYEEFLRQHEYGLSNQTLQKWWTDWLTALAVTCIAGGLFLWVPYLLLRKSPRRWWLYTAAAAIPFIVVANLVAPIWIAPLFNKFEPMRDQTLETRILGWRIVPGSRAAACSRSTRASIPRR
jgi:STE24 endopeptidase